MPARVIAQVTGRMFNVALEEDRAFWEWVIVETLRHSGIRIEELSELTHLSIRQYQRPNGEVAALLVIAPSKTDRERVIPMPAELFAIIAAIIRRHLHRQSAIPLLPRYDKHERVWSEPMPFLFQRKLGTSRAVLSTQTIQRMLQRPCLALAQTRPEFAGLTFTAHDFRRHLRDRRLAVRVATPHRCEDLRPHRPGHHHGLCRDLPRRRDLPPPGVHRPPPGRAAHRRIP
jgi:hypothetical protein